MKHLLPALLAASALQAFAQNNCPCPPPPPPPPALTGSFGAGVSMTRGNTDTTNFNLAFAEVRYLRDQFKDIVFLVTPMVGAGYNAVKNDTFSLAVDGAVGGAFEKDSGHEATSSGAFRVGEAFLWKLSPVAALTQNAYGLWKTKTLPTPSTISTSPSRPRS